MKSENINIEELQNIIQYRFHNTDILIQALTHSSYSNEKKLPKEQNNERLEFLGDAVLELVSSDYLFHKSHEAEGKLTKQRASMVCEPSLAICAREIHLGSFLNLGKGEDYSGGRDRDSLISDALEALIGAIYLDGGLEPAREFIMDHVLNDLERKKLFYDSKTILQEMIQARKSGDLMYELTAEEGPDHCKTFIVQVSVDHNVLGSGTGHSKKSAEQAAAYEAIMKIRG